MNIYIIIMHHPFLRLKQGHTLDSSEQKVLDNESIEICNWCFIQSALFRAVRWWRPSEKLIKSNLMISWVRIQSLLSYPASCKQPRILSQLSHISFPHLQNILLFGNLIGSIELLVRLNMPVLEGLYISSHILTQTTTKSPESKPFGNSTGQTSKPSA